MSAEDKARGKSAILNSSENGKSRPPTNGQPGEDCGANMYVNNLEYIDLDTPARHGHVNLEYIDASCFSSPALTHSFLGPGIGLERSAVATANSKYRPTATVVAGSFGVRKTVQAAEGGERREGDDDRVRSE